MRNTINVVDNYFNDPGGPDQVPDRLIIHRQGNPGASVRDSIAWAKRTGAFTIHEYIEDVTVYHCQHWHKMAFHVKEHRKAAERGFVASGAWGFRGDYNAIGVETQDEPGGGPGQDYSLSQDTRISLVLRLRDICSITGLPVEAISSHSEWDPWQRSEDLGNALYIPDLREDVRDVLASRDPWRTVQKYAFGKPAPESWRPIVSSPLVLPPGSAIVSNEPLPKRLTLTSDADLKRVFEAIGVGEGLNGSDHFPMGYDVAGRAVYELHLRVK